MRAQRFLIGTLVILFVLVAGCGPAAAPPGQTAVPTAPAGQPTGAPPADGGTSTPTASRGGEATDYESLVDQLRAAGATVELAEEISQPFFPVKGRVITANGHDVQLFEFESEAAAKAQAAEISSTGSTIGTTMVTWVEPPHFYQQGRLIVLYVGSDEQLLDLLSSVLGPQIAGGQVDQPAPGQAPEAPTPTPSPARQRG